MKPFDLSLLFMPTIFIFIFTTIIAAYVTRSLSVSLFSALIKAGVFLTYYGIFFDGTFTFSDDWGYFDGGLSLLDSGVGLLNLTENWELVLATGGGDHFLYYLYNTYAFRLFGVGYYSPVALNIILTVLVAWIGSVIGEREFGFSGQWKKIFFVYLIFHPDIFAWSNVMNGKDTLVLLMHVLLLFSVSSHFIGRSGLAVVIAVPVVFALFFLRFYVPVIFLSALLVVYLPNMARPLVLIKWTVASFFVFYVLESMVGHLIPQAFSVLQEHPINPVIGFIHMSLTPIPFNTDASYAFLNFPSLLHWLMIPLVVYGAIVLVNGEKKSFRTFFILYLLVFMGLYSINSELTGPRHRMQLDFAWAVLQFIGIKQFLKSLLLAKNSSGPRYSYVARSENR